MKTTKIRLVLGLFAVFSIVFGSSLKVWQYPYHDLFLVLGMISLIALIVSIVPKNDSFLDNWF